MLARAGATSGREVVAALAVLFREEIAPSMNSIGGALVPSDARLMTEVWTLG